MQSGGAWWRGLSGSGLRVGVKGTWLVVQMHPCLVRGVWGGQLSGCPDSRASERGSAMEQAGRERPQGADALAECHTELGGVRRPRVDAKGPELGSVCPKTTDFLHLPWVQKDGEELAGEGRR